MRISRAFVVVALMLLLSQQTLTMLGVNYMMNGIVFERIHPATYVGAILTILVVFGHGEHRPIAMFRNNPAAGFFLFAAVLLTVYSAVLLSVPITGLFDTWYLPVFVFILCMRLTFEENERLRIFMDRFFVVNSIVAILEAVSGQHLIPFSIANASAGGMIYVYEWRSTALLGHPLINSYVTGCYLIVLILQGRIERRAYRLAAIALHLLAMMFFASRAGTVLVFATIGLYFLYQVLRGITIGKISQKVVYLYMIGLPFLIAGAGLGVSLGLADRFIERFSNDDGSAYSRQVAINMVSDLGISNLWTGIPSKQMFTLADAYGTDRGIESFWVGILLTFGIIGYLILFPALCYFLALVVKRTNKENIFVLIYFFACCTTSVSLSSKSLMLGMVTAILLTSRNKSEIFASSRNQASKIPDFSLKPAPTGASYNESKRFT